MTQTFGRKQIYTSLEVSATTIPSILNNAFTLHSQNYLEMKYLIDYFRGDQPILDRVKTVRSDIMNTVVINYAWAIVRDITGYFMGTPVQYTPKNTDKMALVQELNSAMDLECRSTVDKQVEEFVSICGIGHKATLADLGESENEVPFTVSALSPLNTFVVYGVELGNAPVLAVNYFDYTDEMDNSRRIIYVYTKKEYYQYNILAGEQVAESHLVKGPIPHYLGSIPIVEYRNNQWLMGDFEIVTSILDAINTLASNSLDDVEQIVQSILLLFGINADQHDDVANLSNGDVLVFSGEQGITQDGKYLSAPLDGQAVALLREYFEEAFKMVAGIPDRKTRGGGGGDTGDAVKLRDGWADIELVARNKELFWREAEMRSLRLALNLMKTKKKLTGLEVADVDIKFSRNKNDNLQSKVTAGSTLYAMGMDKSDIATIMDITTDIAGMVERWGAAEEEKAQKALDIMTKQKATEEPDTDDGDGSTGNE